MAGDTFRDAIRGALNDILTANPSITWPHKDTLNTGVKPDASTGYFELEFFGGDESQYTFGAPGANDWQEIGQVTVRAVVRQNAGTTERNKAESFMEIIRAAFRGRRITLGSRAIRIKSTAAMGSGQDEGGMWVESIALGYERFNTG